MRRITERQKTYLREYLDGKTMKQIAEKYGKNISTISRTIRRTDTACPFGICCEECVLTKCGLSEEAIEYLARNEKTRMDKRKYRELERRLKDEEAD